jgi:hypothetical protein
VVTEDVDTRNEQYAELAAKLQSDDASVDRLHAAAVWSLHGWWRGSSHIRWSTTSSPPTSPSAAADEGEVRPDDRDIRDAPLTIGVAVTGNRCR